MTEAWKRLKSGTDIRGVAVAEHGKPATLTVEVGAAVGAAFIRWLRKKTGRQDLTVAVGRDSRVSGEALSAALIRGMNAEGNVSALDCGLCTTPAMFMTTLLAGTDAAVMVTASHLPWQRNGYKFFTPEGGLSGGDVAEILELASEISPKDSEAAAKPVDFLATYTEFLRDRARAALGGEKPLSGLHVVVDAGNGAGGFYADFLSSLGARVDGSQFLEPDGHFPGHIPNPEAQEAMDSLSEAVIRAGADLGVLFDADCDRAALVDASGKAVNRNRLIALIADILIRENPGATIVTDSVSSAGLADFLCERGGVLHRFKRGYNNVIGEARRLCAQGVDCPLAIETSGHAALRENHFLDDGMYLVTRLIIEAVRLKQQGKALCSLIDSLAEPAEGREVRLAIRAEDFRPVGERALDDVRGAAARHPGWQIDPKNQEGVRVACGGAGTWFLLRMSLHDPLLVLNLESDHAGGVAEMLSALQPLLSAFDEM